MNEIASMLNLKPMGILSRTLTTNGWKVNFRDLLLEELDPEPPPNKFSTTLLS